MLDDGRNNQCGHSAELVSYMYGECSESQAADFESHLEKCFTCASELSSFTTIRSSLGEMRHEANVSAPRLAADFSGGRSKSSWVESLMALFGGARGFAAAGAFAVVLMAIVTVFVMNRNGDHQSQEIASNTSKTPSSATQSLTTNTNEASTTTRNEPLKPGEVPPGKTLSADPSKDEGHAPEGQSPKRTKVRNQKAVEKTPTLSNYDEEEDKSLRLADIFEDIGE